VGVVKVVGGVALVRADEVSDPEAYVKRILSTHPRIKAVIKYWGVEGVYRTPRVEVLWGHPPSSILYREYGVEYELDPLSLMFSLGNKFERLRVSRLVRRWETVVDMFAGVGQFSLPIAFHARPKKVYSIELNPRAFSFLERNIERNRLSDVIEPIQGDCRVVAEKIGPVADRIVMGYILDTLGFLPYALKMLGRAGGIIHLHSLVRRGSEQDFALEAERAVLSHGFAAKVVKMRRVKSYSPSKNHIVIDLFAVSERPPSSEEPAALGSQPSAPGYLASDRPRSGP
jgi:tRNA wybutosine-synthesizing protein 2